MILPQEYTATKSGTWTVEYTNGLIQQFDMNKKDKLIVHCKHKLRKR